AGIRGEAWTSVSGAAGPSDVALLVSGMMTAPALAAARVLQAAGAVTVVVNIPVIKPLDTATVLAIAAASKALVTPETYSVIGGRGAAAAEPVAGAGRARPLRAIGLADPSTEGARDAPYLFTNYGLPPQYTVNRVWPVPVVRGRHPPVHRR